MTRGLRGGSLLLLLPALLFVALLFVYPFIYGLLLSVTTEGGGLTLKNYVAFFGDPWEARTIWVTLRLAIPATLINVGLAIPLAYYMRHGRRGGRAITFFLILPLTLGTVLVAQGMLNYMGPTGWLNQLLMLVGIARQPVQFTHNSLGVLLSLIIQGLPFAFLMILGYVSGINPDLEKASQMLGASKWQTFLRIMLPLMVPGIAICFCLVFVMEFSVFPTAVLLGQPSGPTRVISLAAYQWAFEKFDFHISSAITMTMAAIELIVISVVLAGRNRMQRSASMVGGKG